MTTDPSRPDAANPEDAEPTPAPEFTGGEWIAGNPVTVADHDGPMLVEFWDYTSNNCIRTQPYLAEWHRRYAEHGFTVVGVHTPEFSFSRNPDHVRGVIQELSIPYPVVLDPDYEIWRAYQNHYWPARYFIDASGMLRAAHFGEGAYAESEQLIQGLLREQPGFAAELPTPMDPLRPEDATGVVPFRVTPELYCGYQRGSVGNTTAIVPDRPHRYFDPGHHVEGVLYLDGDWIVGSESLARPFGATTHSRATLAYMAGDINLVLHPPAAGGGGALRVLLDGEPLRGDLAGADVVDGTVTVDHPRMYRLVASAEVARHELTLETDSDGLAAFAFTFGSTAAPRLSDEGATDAR